MADLTDIEAAQSVKIIGSDSSGVETTPLVVNSDGSINIVVPPSNTTDTLTSLNDLFVFDNTIKGFGALGLQITGTWVGTITPSVSVDGTNYVNVSVHNIVSGQFTSSMTANGLFTINIGGIRSVKLTMTAYTSGTATITYFGTAAKSQAETVNVAQSTSAAGVSNQTRVPTIETEHQKIHEGKLFSFTEVNILSSGVTRHYLFTPLTNTAHWIYDVNSQDGVAIDLFELTTLTGVTTTTTFTSYNKSRNSATTATATVQLATVVPALSNPLFTFDTGSASNIQKSIGRSSEWDLKVGNFYVFRITSNNVSNTITTEFLWYEG